jgi:hypothetical protein
VLFHFVTPLISTTSIWSKFGATTVGEQHESGLSAQGRPSETEGQKSRSKWAQKKIGVKDGRE